MAVNQVSLFFYPPRWEQRLTSAPASRTAKGQRLWIADAVRVKNADGPAIPAEELTAWLTEQGFISADWGRGSIFLRGQVDSIFGLEEEVQISVGDLAGEVTELCCRFTLPRHPPPQLSEWAGFVMSLCQRFNLRLGGKGIAPCNEAEFVAAVRDHYNWREFASSFGWEGGNAFPETSPGNGSD